MVDLLDRHPGRGQRGLTLLELMIGLFMSALLMVGILSLWTQAQQSYMLGSEAADVQQNLRVAVDRIARVVQQAGVNPRNQQWAGATPNDSAFTAFRFAGRSCLRLYADLDGNGNVQGTDENVSFGWSGTDGAPLTQEMGAGGGDPDAGQPWVAAATGPQELAGDVVANPGGAPIFRYFTAPGDPSPNTELTPPNTPCGNLSDADRSRIGRVVITLTARGQVGGQTFAKTLVTEARPRNVP